MDAAIIEQGIDLMLYGMGTVFIFLTVLVFSTSLMSILIERFFPEAVPVVSEKTTPVAQVSQPVEPRTLQVIQEAIYQHRAKTK